MQAAIHEVQEHDVFSTRFAGSEFLDMGVSEIRGTYWGPYCKGILLCGDYSRVPCFRKPPNPLRTESR